MIDRSIDCLRRIGRFAAAGAGGAALLTAWLVSVDAAAQNGAGNEAAMPRLPNGRPDFQGVWTNKTVTPFERPEELGDKEFFTPEEAEAFVEEQLQESNKDVRGGGVRDVLNAYNAFWWDSGADVLSNMRTSIVYEPSSGRIPPLTAERRAELEAEQRALEERCEEPGCAITNSGELAPAADPKKLDLMTRCISFGTVVPMLPTAYNNNYEIVQSEGMLGILTEMVHQVRRIPTDGSGGKPPSDVRQWFGVPNGHWEGDTLVVETTNFKGEMFGRLSPADENLRVVERFSLVGPDTLLYQFTVDDPTAWERPWSGEIPLTRIDGMLYEYACHEGNRGMRNILKAAREDIRRAGGVDH